MGVSGGSRPALVPMGTSLPTCTRPVRPSGLVATYMRYFLARSTSSGGSHVTVPPSSPSSRSRSVKLRDVTLASSSTMV